MDQINQAIVQLRKHLLLDNHECTLLEEKLRPFQLDRKGILIQPGQQARDVAFITAGCMQAYSIDEQGTTHILQFAPPEWWITDMHSFISKQPAHLLVDALLPSAGVLLSREDQLDLFDRVPKIERHFRILTENALVGSRQRILDGMSLTARDRYDKFCRTYPSLINAIPQKRIAQFLGITPEFLSKIRAQF
jgi:CRP-like cAMP-binding protein